MDRRNILCVGASAGGVSALRQLVAALPRDLPAAVFVVLHIPAHGDSALPRVLERAGPLPVALAVHGERIMPGRIYVAPANRHLMLGETTVQVVYGPRENGSRPAIDPLFRSAAVVHRARVAGMVLSGTRDDGAAGLRAIKDAGGLALVQDPLDADYPSMPQAALDLTDADCIGTVPALVQCFLARLEIADAAPPRDPDVTRALVDDLARTMMDQAVLAEEPTGHPSPFACPACGGVLWGRPGTGHTHFRCRTGHAYSAGALLDAQSDGYEDALWAAVRALKEAASLARRLEERAKERAQTWAEHFFGARAARAERRAVVIENLLAEEPPMPDDAAGASQKAPSD